MSVDAIMIKESDNVATALIDIEKGETATVAIENVHKKVIVKEKILYGHKFAVRDIAKEEPIIKYGEVMGRATQSIDAGFHAHIHNIESLRGRGDL